jgi:hypothetical protein
MRMMAAGTQTSAPPPGMIDNTLITVADEIRQDLGRPIRVPLALQVAAAVQPEQPRSLVPSHGFEGEDPQAIR